MAVPVDEAIAALSTFSLEVVLHILFSIHASKARDRCDGLVECVLVHGVRSKIILFLGIFHLT